MVLLIYCPSPSLLLVLTKLTKNMSVSALCYGSFLWLGSYLTGEAGLGLVSDDHTPSPIRQMDQGSNSEISSSAKSERNTNLGHKLNLPLCFVPW
jgi:hypothetical protein